MTQVTTPSVTETPKETPSLVERLREYAVTWTSYPWTKRDVDTLMLEAADALQAAQGRIAELERHKERMSMLATTAQFTLEENQRLRIQLEAAKVDAEVQSKRIAYAEDLLRSLRTARPLHLYGETWVEEIDKYFAAIDSARGGANET